MQFQNRSPVSPPVNRESAYERRYTTVLIVMFFVVIGESIFQYLRTEKMGWFFHDFSVLKKLCLWITTLAWAYAPLFIFLMLRKRNGGWAVMVVFAGIYSIWKLAELYYNVYVQPQSFWDAGSNMLYHF